MYVNKNDRCIYDFSVIGINIFEEFGRYNYKSVQKRLPLHSHKNAVEVCFLAKGKQTYVVNNQSFHLTGGSLFVTYPNEWHSTGNEPEEKGILYWFSVIQPHKNDDFLGLSENEAYTIFNKLAGLPQRIFRGNCMTKQIFREIERAYCKDYTVLNIIKLKNLLLSLFLNIIDCGYNGHKEQKIDDAIFRSMEYIDNHIFDSLDLEEVADISCLSLSYFKHRFKQETGIPPSEYIMRKKIEAAEALLRENKVSVRNIAYDLGFSSPGYFSMVYKKYKGYSPGNIRKNTNGSNEQNENT